MVVNHESLSGLGLHHHGTITCGECTDLIIIRSLHVPGIQFAYILRQPRADIREIIMFFLVFLIPIKIV